MNNLHQIFKESIGLLLLVTTGHYLYIESSEKYSHQHARINTVTMTAANLVMDIEKICLGFYYHMKGHTMGNLTVFLQDTSTGVEEKLFQLSGNQGNKWRRATIPVNTPKSDFKVALYEISFTSYFFADFATCLLTCTIIRDTYTG